MTIQLWQHAESHVLGDWRLFALVSVLIQPFSSNSSHNVGTFAGAVGGSVGVLSLFGLGLALSIARRRHLSAKRERAYREQEASDRESLRGGASEDGPPMQGPAPFVPRYFPGTAPRAPPSYAARPISTPPPSPTPPPAALTVEPASIALPSSPTSSVRYAPLPTDQDESSDTRSYAERPPPTPPPPDDDGVAPPSFGVAIQTPMPTVLARAMLSSQVPVAPELPAPVPTRSFAPSLFSVHSRETGEGDYDSELD